MAIRSRRIFAQVIKELTQLGRDRLTLTMALGLPLLLLPLFGFAVSFDVNNINFAVQDLSRTPISREYIATFERTNKFNIVAQGPEVNVPELLDQGRISAGLVIPPEFARDLQRRGQEAQVQVLIDGTDGNSANLIRGYAQATNSAFLQNLQNQNSPPINLESRLWFNPGLDILQYIGPGAIAVTVILFPPLLAALATTREKEQATIVQVYASSLTGAEYLLGKATAYWLVGLADILLVNLEAWLFFGLWFAGDPTPMIVSSGAYMMAGVLWGVFVGSNSSTQSSAIQTMAFTGFLLSLQLSGFIFPLENIPAAVRWITNLVPARYYVVLTRDAYVRGVGWASTWSSVLALVALSGFFFFLAWRRLRKMQLEG